MKQALVLISSFAATVSGFAPCHLPQQTISSSTNLNMMKEEKGENNRRQVLSSIFGGIVTATIASSSTTVANALDMDAFINAELANDTKNCDPKRDPKCAPQMTSDEATCKYGQAGKAKSEACKRLKSEGKEIPKANQGKSLGGAYAM